MADHRDTNHDGKVSMMEKVKDKLHLGGHSSTTHNTHTTAGHTNTTGAVPIIGQVPVVAAMPVAGTAAMHDSRDLNHDGHISTSERLAAGSTHTGATHAGSMHTGATHAGSIHTGATHQSEEARLRLHEEQLAISKREVGAGEVGIHKRVHEENVQQTIPVRREEVIVERRPLSGMPDHNATISAQDETMRVPLHREEIVAEKRVVPTEEVIVRKKQVTEHQNVGATLRSEHLETVQTGAHTTAGMAHENRADLNHDGHVSLGEKLKNATHMGSHARG